MEKKYLSYEGLQYLYSKILTKFNLKVDKSGGDVSETVVESLETIETKFPIPSAGEKVKTFFGKILTFLRNIKPLESDVTYYVATTGSDKTGDGTQEKPFRTIQFTIDKVPKNMTNKSTATIYISNGTYPEDLFITGYSGTLQIMGLTRVDTLNNNVKINSIECTRCIGGYVVLNGLTFTSSKDSTVNIYACSNVLLEFISVEAMSANTGGIGFYECSMARARGCRISNRYVAIYCSNSTGYIDSCTGTNNNVGISSNMASTVHTIGTIPGAATSRQQSNCGTFVNQNGSLISEPVNSGLSCTWGTISGGVIRHSGIQGGAGMMTVNISVAVTTALAVGTSYSILGFPKPASSGPAVNFNSPTSVITAYNCFIDNSGNLSLKVGTAIPTGTTVLFTATYLVNS